jgi:23S rRNA-/tRNA-specific pseudouridylate synthase
MKSLISHHCSSMATNAPLNMVHEKHVVTMTYNHSGEPIPLYELIMRLRPDESKTSAKRACRRGKITVDGLPPQCPSSIIKEGQLVQSLSRNGASTVNRQHIGVSKHLLPLLEQMTVVFQDEHFAIITKPPGLATQSKGDGIRGFLPYVLKPSSEIGALHRPQHCHRLDLWTGGLLVCAKTRQALSVLSEDFAEGGVIKKTYSAIVKGQVKEGDQLLDKPLRGQRSVTNLLERGRIEMRSVKYGTLTTLLLQPITGRKHQIRRHLSECVGTPILGDRRYSGGRQLEEEREGTESEDLIEDEEEADTFSPPQRQGEILSDGKTLATMCLWAVEISLLHPVSRERLEFQLPGGEPEAFRRIREIEQDYIRHSEDRDHY